MKFLSYFKCRHCATWACTAGESGPYVRCNGCGGAKKFEYRVDVEGEHNEMLFRLAKERGVLHLPIPETGPRACVRCGEISEHTMLRPDGLVCRECYKAEARPVFELLTPEQIVEGIKAREEADRQAREHERNGQEAAYAALEGEQQ
jgi:hypothetical protein